MIGVTDILKEFSSDEIKNLERFLDSPYHNKSQKVKKLFREIKKFYPSFSDKQLTKKYLLKKVSPSLKYNDSTFRNLHSDLQILIEKFLIIEQLFQSGDEKNIYLLKSLIDKRQVNLFEITLKKTGSQLEKAGVDDAYFYIKSCLEMCTFNNDIINRREKSQKSVERNIATINRYIICLINFFISEIINSHLKISVKRSKFKTKEGVDFSSKLIEIIDIKKISQLVKDSGSDNFVLDIYLQLFLAFQNLNYKQYFLNYKSLIGRHYKRLKHG